MISVEEAEHIILSHTRDYGNELISFECSLNRVLAEPIKADRDLPPFNRVTMDGIAICYDSWKQGIRKYKVKSIQPAGVAPGKIENKDDCIEIMTGAALPEQLDSVIRYEDVHMQNGIATISDITVQKGQNIHYKGKDKHTGDVIVSVGEIIDATVIGAAASVGAMQLAVKKLPGTVIISTGDELTQPGKMPDLFQIRTSNTYAIKSSLQQFGINADQRHVSDDENKILENIKDCLEKFDIIILTGGVSMGKFDFVPKALQQLNVKTLFHKVKQRPGKPFWFGVHPNGSLVFAFPGNPVSTFLCLHRYFVPWLKKSLGINGCEKRAILAEDFSFPAALQYFLQVKLKISSDGRLLAYPVEGNGSGDFSNLTAADAFLELPSDLEYFSNGSVYPLWIFK